MNCRHCGFTLDTELAKLTKNACPSCGRDLRLDAVELLSDTSLGFVKEMRPGQVEYARLVQSMLDVAERKTAMLEGGCGVGKAQTLEARVLSPTGWRRMGDLKRKDRIIGADGKVHHIIGVYPQGLRPVFRVTFTDGSSTECCDQHLWKIQNKKDRAQRRSGRVRMLQDLQQEGLKTGREHNHWIPIAKPAEFNPKTRLPLDPYLLGLLLGDGGFTVDGSCSFTKKDAFIIDAIREILPVEDELHTLKQSDNYHIGNRVPFRPKQRGAACSATVRALREMGLSGLGSHEKFIPEAYKWTTVANRHALLQGLLDTDGGVSQGHILEYSTTSPRLAEDVKFLVQSLGGVTSLAQRQTYFTHKGVRKPGRPSYRLFPCLPTALAPFRLPRKADNYIARTTYLPRRAIAKIEFVGNKKTQCIAVDAPDHLYITDEFIVTHNTFGYGVPAALSGKRVIISTGKKSLQDQLAQKDIPHLQKTLGTPVTFVTLKGKSNYLCQRLLKKNKNLFKTPEEEATYAKLVEWIAEDKTGDLDAFPGDRPYIMSKITAVDCNKCHRATTCGFRQARNNAKEAQVVIVNHSLLGFDLRLGVGKLFNEYDILIIDEAHTAADFMRRAFSDELSEAWLPNQFNQLIKGDVFPAALMVGRDKAEALWKKLFKTVPDASLLPPGFFGDVGHEMLEELRRIERVLYADFLQKFAPVSADKEKELLFAGPSFMVLEDARPDDEDDEDAYEEMRNVLEKIGKKADLIGATYNEDDNWINCKEVNPFNHKIKIVRQPVNLGPLLKTPLSAINKIIFTSATMNFAGLKSELAVYPDYELTVPSPFPFNRSLIYIPKHLPRPATDGYHAAMGDEIVSLIRASRGNALVLFSSMRDLQEINTYILCNYNLKHPIFAQSADHRPAEVFQSFMKTDNSVIFGSRSFFEGIDVQGTKLRLVVIAKIPFPPREDPLNQAKERILGKQAFWNQWYFPNMLHDIQQAAGRLIRAQNDRGVLALLDVRIWVGGNKELDPAKVGSPRVPWKGYGQRIIKALPFPNFTPRRELVEQFYTNVLGAAE